MTESQAENARGFVPVTLEEGTWKTAEGNAVPWYEVQTDLLAQAEVEGAVSRVLSVYGVSDVVVDAFSQFQKELERPSEPG